MADSLALSARHYDKLGALHCGVIREGRITVAGEIADIADGEEVVMRRGNVKVVRKGDEYTFAKAD